MNLFYFLNSNFFIALTALFVGFFVVVIYIFQKKDQKKNAANIILSEIRNAEKVLDEIKRVGSEEGLRNLFVMPTNNWNNYSHLFIKDFDSDEWNLMNDFYSKCTLTEKTLEVIRSNLYSQLGEKAKSVQHFLGQLAKDAISDADYDNKKKIFLDRFQREGHLFRPSQPLRDLIILLDVPKITTSTIGLKLKKIANVK